MHEVVESKSQAKPIVIANVFFLSFDKYRFCAEFPTPSQTCHLVFFLSCREIDRRKRRDASQSFVYRSCFVQSSGV